MAARNRSPQVLSLTVLLLGAAAMLALAVAFPMSDQAPVELGSVMIGVALAMAAGTYVAGDRLPPWVLLAQAVLAAVLNSVLVAAAHTRAGAIGDAIAYGWLTAYVAIFFPRFAIAWSALVAAGFGAGLLIADLPRMIAAWGLVSLATLVLALVLAHVSRVVRRHLHTDPLTGALNRTGLEAAATAAFARTRRRNETLSIAMLDLDGFKQVNDDGGHALGDRTLAAAAGAWRDGLRGDDALARIGGDEFVVLLPATDRDAAQVVLARLQAQTEAAWSSGIAQWREGESLDETLRRADRRLYEEKARRREAA
jgi:diguanylate cyclase (GGDEF)-like protein